MKWNEEDPPTKALLEGYLKSCSMKVIQIKLESLLSYNINLNVKKFQI